MLYRPNFCCNCGEKIERAEWNLLTSRRFCAVCADEQKKHDILPRAAVVGGVLAAVFGMGTLMAGRGTEPVPIKSLKESRPLTVKPSAENKGPVEQQSTAANRTDAEIGEQPPPQKGTSTGTVHFCKAPTKKGTPCSRRVKSAGTRCWQHEGKESADGAN